MKTLNLLASILISIFCFQPNLSFSDTAADRRALIIFRSAVGGNKRRWNTSNPSPCSWEGVTCDNSSNPRVTALRLPGAGLSGQIPLNSIGSLTQLRTLSLRGNRISGGIPSDINLCSQLRNLYLQNNQLSGDIPVTLFMLSNLIRIDISHNNFSGSISTSFNNLTRLSHLFLQNNQFTGEIPDINTRLSQFNVSVNRLNGRIPTRFSTFPINSFSGNNDLCGSPLSSCENEGNSNELSAGAIAGIVIGSVLGLVLIVIMIFYLGRKFNISRSSRQAVQDVASTIPPSPEKLPEYDFRSPDRIMVGENTGSDEGYSSRVENKDELVFFGGEGGFLLDDLLRASAEVLGKGSIGTTYKAYLDHGGEVIVKRLRNVCVSKREFTKRIVCIGELYHENLLPIRGYYFGKEEKLLVFDPMPMGSLSLFLNGNKEAHMEERSLLTWEVRSRIACQVASGLEHLHSHNLSHGNIKSNNILLTKEFQALISESGLIQLVSSPTPSLSGYRAPELIDTRIASKEADVYSFGILILELLTGKDPTILVNEEGIDLPTWVQSVDEGKWKSDVIDLNLVKDSSNDEKIIKLLHLGIRCASKVPRRRGSIADVARQIEKICVV